MSLSSVIETSTYKDLGSPSPSTILGKRRAIMTERNFRNIISEERKLAIAIVDSTVCHKAIRVHKKEKSFLVIFNTL